VALSDKVEVTGLAISEIDERGWYQLSGEMDASELSECLIQHWVPYMECYQCPRADSCRFSIARGDGPNKFGEIRCGVTETALRHFVTRTFPIFSALDKNLQQNYLDGAFHFARFVHDAEQMIGMQTSEPHLDYWSHLVPYVFGQVANLRGRLDAFAEALSSVPDFNTRKGVLLVEGWSEKRLFERLRLTGINWFTRLRVESYEGKSSRRPRRIELLIKYFQSNGYLAYISGDADGGPLNIFDALIDRKLVGRQNTHVFRYDFETGLPPQLLFQALQEVGELTSVSEEEFCARVSAHEGSVLRLLKREYRVDVDALKVEIGDAVGGLMSIRWNWHRDKEFMGSELGQLLQMVQQMP
jgi:hypothetical protein